MNSIEAAVDRFKGQAKEIRENVNQIMVQSYAGQIATELRRIRRACWLFLIAYIILHFV